MQHTTTFIDEQLNVFWSIVVSSNSYTVTHGKIGTEGETETKTFKSENARQQATSTLLAKITRKPTKEGYGFTFKNEDNNNTITYGIKKVETKATKPKKSKVQLKEISEYKEKKWSSLSKNQFVVNLKKIESVAEALRWQIDNAELFLKNFKQLSSDGFEAFSYGIIENKEFIPLCQTSQFENEGDSDEEIIANYIANYPALYPITAQYIEKVVLRASKEETTGGPWATEETIFGQFIIPMLAEEDKEYTKYLKTFIDTNVEIRFSPNFSEKFKKIADRIDAKYNSKTVKADKPEDKETKLLSSFLKNYKTTFDFALTSPPGKTNQFSSYQIQKKFGYQTPRTNVFPKLMVVVKEELDKKKMPYDTILLNAYSILKILDSHIPLKRLQSVMDSIKKGEALPVDNKIINEKHEWDFWEKANPIGGKKGTNILYFSTKFEDKNELEKVLRQFVDQFEQYSLAWKFSGFYNMSIINSSIIAMDNSDREHNDESDLFLAVAKFPELSPLVIQYVEKVTDENKQLVSQQSPLINSIRMRGVEAAAVMAYFDESNDDKVLDFLNSIPIEFLEDNYMGLYAVIRNFWKKAGKTPNLPNTFKIHTKLQS